MKTTAIGIQISPRKRKDRRTRGEVRALSREITETHLDVLALLCRAGFEIVKQAGAQYVLNHPLRDTRVVLSVKMSGLPDTVRKMVKEFFDSASSSLGVVARN
jgi:predicted RNA binding protein YcfA (HicA-like mRNA interferase family)